MDLFFDFIISTDSAWLNSTWVNSLAGYFRGDYLWDVPDSCTSQAAFLKTNCWFFFSENNLICFQRFVNHQVIFYSVFSNIFLKILAILLLVIVFFLSDLLF